MKEQLVIEIGSTERLHRELIFPQGKSGKGGLKRYAYCDNNPVKYSDPSGHQKKNKTGKQSTNKYSAAEKSKATKKKSGSINGSGCGKTYTFARNVPADPSTPSVTSARMTKLSCARPGVTLLSY